MDTRPRSVSRSAAFLYNSMANLISHAARKQVIRSYWLRVGTVWLVLLAVAAATVAILMAPTYLLIDAQHAALADRISATGSRQEAYESMRKEIEAASELATYIDTHDDGLKVMAYVDAIETAAEGEVHIARYAFASGGEKDPPAITLEGVAGDRAILASFKERLESSGSFDEVELPLGSLAGDRDIAFSMRLSLAQSDL